MRHIRNEIILEIYQKNYRSDKEKKNDIRNQKKTEKWQNHQICHFSVIFFSDIDIRNGLINPNIYSG